MAVHPAPLLALVLLLGLPAAGPAEQRAAPGKIVDYRDVQPILVGRCAKCHAPQGMMGPAPEGYSLASYAETLAQGERARVVPGLAEASELVRRIRGQARPRMPFDGPPFLDETEIALIVAWIDQGARDAQGNPAPAPRGAKLRLHGRLGANGQLDGLALRITAASRVEDAPQPGDYVQVRGRLLKDGSLLVERIRRH